MTTDLRKLNNYWLVREGGQLIWADWVVVRNFEKKFIGNFMILFSKSELL